jgi:hypothetical protein
MTAVLGKQTDVIPATSHSNPHVIPGNQPHSYEKQEDGRHGYVAKEHKHQEYPKSLYKDVKSENGPTERHEKVVENAAEEKAAAHDGFKPLVAKHAKKAKPRRAPKVHKAKKAPKPGPSEE